MKKKSLLIYIPSIESGGVEKLLYLITNYFVKKKLSVTILTAFNYKKKYFDKKAEIVSLKNNNNNLATFIIFKDFLSLKKVKLAFLTIFPINGL